MPGLIAAMVGLSVSLLIFAIFRSNRSELAEVRVTRLADETEDADPLARSFVQRVVQPVISKATGAAMVVLPSRVVASIRGPLETAGAPISLRSFLMIWLISGLEIGGASCRASVCQYVSTSGVAGAIKQQETQRTRKE